jgi:hypothetical protein
LRGTFYYVWVYKLHCKYDCSNFKQAIIAFKRTGREYHGNSIHSQVFTG